MTAKPSLIKQNPNLPPNKAPPPVFHHTPLQRPLTEVGGFGLAEVPVELRAVGLLQPRAEAEVGQLDVTPRVQQQVVRLDVPVERREQSKNTAGCVRIRIQRRRRDVNDIKQNRISANSLWCE